jgi:D-alanyl-D-alanine dipeptidase
VPDPSTRRRGKEFTLLARRVSRHLLRRRALLAFIGIAIAIGIAAVVGADSPVGQVALVAIGTLASLALLPEEPHRLWNVDAQVLADTVPTRKLRDAGREVVEAIALQGAGLVPADLMQQVTSVQIDELERLSATPAAIVRHLDYRVSITGNLDRVTIEATLTGERYLPGTSRIFVSFCSNMEALGNEYGAQAAGCILRELVDRSAHETRDMWVKRVSAYSVSAVIDGRLATVLETPSIDVGSADSIVVRFVFDAGPLSQRFAHLRVEARFENPDSGEFSMKFSSYYCVGATNLRFDLRYLNRSLDFSEYLSTASRPIHIEKLASRDVQRVLVSTAEDVVLPPGSGIVFQWRSGAAPLLLQESNLQLKELVEGEPLSTPQEPPAFRHPSADTGEPLTAVTAVDTFDAYGALNILPPRTLRVRASVEQRLADAQALLPKGFQLIVLDGWRSLAEQATLIEHYAAAGAEYVASIDSNSMRPPHVTGGAVDVTLAYRGKPLALGTDYDSFNPSAHLCAFESIDGIVRRLRRVLASAMLGGGFAPYPYEWWHWSFGDDVWAQFTQHGAVLYEVIPE